MEPIPAPVPPRPATEPTALAGKKSLGRVCTLFIQAWNPNNTTALRATAGNTTALAAKKSLGRVCSLFIQAWNPNKTTPISARAAIELGVNAASIPAGIRHAATMITVLRAELTDQPRDIKKPER